MVYRILLPKVSKVPYPFERLHYVQDLSGASSGSVLLKSATKSCEAEKLGEHSRAAAHSDLGVSMRSVSTWITLPLHNTRRSPKP